MYMIQNIIRNILKKPATRNYPFVKREPFSGFRGRLLNDIDNCIFCKSCQLRCPTGCIEMQPKEGTWDYNPFACVYCGVCVDVCPTKCLTMSNIHQVPSPEKILITLQGTPKGAKKAQAKTESAKPETQTEPVAEVKVEPVAAKIKSETAEAKSEVAQLETKPEVQVELVAAETKLEVQAELVTTEAKPESAELEIKLEVK